MRNPTFEVALPCPRCDGEITVEVEIEPGQEEIRYPNDKAQPGYPPTAHIIGEEGRFDCDCDLTSEEWAELEEGGQDAIFDKVDDIMAMNEEAYYERLEDERRDADSLGKY